MNRLEQAKKTIKDNIEYGDCGLFRTRNTADDRMETIYKSDDLQIDICYDYGYFEVFGLTDEEFNELDKYYADISSTVEKYW